jgi:hypothetical protein
MAVLSVAEKFDQFDEFVARTAQECDAKRTTMNSGIERSDGFVSAVLACGPQILLKSICDQREAREAGIIKHRARTLGAGFYV